ncbi:MAG: PilZ domain-containing protein [Thermoanaerobaculia bacterium]|nr:PilZ domain-containing protein [Thermoanaerobaculia bacterium]
MTDTPRDERDPLGLLPDFHRTTRMPLDAVVRLHFEGTVAYQNGFAANVSALGMFVKHPDPPEVGTRLVFEFVLGDERKPVQGGGVVAWVRERYEGPGRPAGVGIQFTELDALSRQHIAESLFEYLETQLGVEVADHPDVPNLLAAMPRTTNVEVAAGVPAAEPAVPQRELSFAGGAADEPPAPSRAPEPPAFRLFGDGERPAGADDDGLLAEAGPDLFAPVTPPESFEPLPSEPYYGSARRRESARWLPVVLVAAIVVAALAAWWFLSGPGAEPAASADADAAQPAPPAERPRLDPQPGPEASLAEAVGVAPTPAPAAGEADDEPLDAAPAASVAAPAPPTPQAAPAIPADQRFTRVTDIAWKTFDGGTDVTLTGDGIFAPGSFRWFEMRDERPRVLVRVTGVAAGFPRPSLTAGTPELAGVRVGFHEKPAGNELHVVLDLGAGGARVEWVDATGDRLVVRLRRP